MGGGCMDFLYRNDQNNMVFLQKGIFIYHKFNFIINYVLLHRRDGLHALKSQDNTSFQCGLLDVCTVFWLICSHHAISTY